MGLMRIENKNTSIAGMEVKKVHEFLAIYLEKEFMGIPLRKVLEISKVLELFPVPLTPSYIRGVINLRGEIIPVISIKQIMGIPQKTQPSRLIILETSYGKVAVEVDSVYGVVKIEEGMLEPNPMTAIYSEFISNVAQIKEGFISIIDLEKVFQERI
jgi:purine-binding chemotaxis protein CheW